MRLADPTASEAGPNVGKEPARRVAAGRHVGNVRNRSRYAESGHSAFDPFTVISMRDIRCFHACGFGGAFPWPTPNPSSPSSVNFEAKALDIENALTPMISASAWAGVLLLIFFRKRLSREFREAIIAFLGGIALLAMLGVGIYLVVLMTSW